MPYSPVSWTIVTLVIAGFLVLLFIYDVLQKRHAILRNFPVVGHLRYVLQSIGPELRQYIVAGNDEEHPFTRDQRTWIYTSAKLQNNYFGFGTDNDLERSPGHLIIHHSSFPLDEPHPGHAGYDPEHRIPAAKVLGAFRKRRRAFRPRSIVNVSAMSYGSLSWAAVEAINRGCAIADCLHNTGEGGVSPYHLKGGETIWQIGTGYFGCRNPDGTFSLERLVGTVDANPSICALEIKLSQGAKPGLGGVLPGVKVTPTIAHARGISVGETCISPPRHSAFDGVDGLLDFVELIAERTGLPVGIKSAVSGLGFWEELAGLMAVGDRGVDFIAIDGGEGGTGAGPLVFTDHVSLPFKVGFSRVYRLFAERDLSEKIFFFGSGRLGFPEQSLLALALGCDAIALAREPLLAIGCIQAQQCHTGHCPTGVTTHNRWLVRGLDPTSKAARLANYMITLRKELLRLACACGEPHPALVPLDRIEFLDENFGSRLATETFGYTPELGLPGAEDREALRAFGASAV
jgi:glutamate synthase (ferredoxin)